MKVDVLIVRDIRRLVESLERDIKRETNSREKVRLVEDQAALKRTIRLVETKVAWTRLPVSLKE